MPSGFSLHLARARPCRQLETEGGPGMEASNSLPAVSWSTLSPPSLSPSFLNFYLLSLFIFRQPPSKNNFFLKKERVFFKKEAKVRGSHNKFSPSCNPTVQLILFKFLSPSISRWKLQKKCPQRNLPVLQLSEGQLTDGPTSGFAGCLCSFRERQD